MCCSGDSLKEQYSGDVSLKMEPILSLLHEAYHLNGSKIFPGERLVPATEHFSLKQTCHTRKNSLQTACPCNMSSSGYRP